MNNTIIHHLSLVDCNKYESYNNNSRQHKYSWDVDLRKVQFTGMFLHESKILAGRQIKRITCTGESLVSPRTPPWRNRSGFDTEKKVLIANMLRLLG